MTSRFTLPLLILRVESRRNPSKVVHRIVERDADKLAAQNPDKAPFLTSPEVHRMWVPDRVEGNKYEEGHNVYMIDKQSVWSR